MERVWSDWKSNQEARQLKDSFNRLLERRQPLSSTSGSSFHDQTPNPGPSGSSFHDRATPRGPSGSNSLEGTSSTSGGVPKLSSGPEASSSAPKASISDAKPSTSASGSKMDLIDLNDQPSLLTAHLANPFASMIPPTTGMIPNVNRKIIPSVTNPVASTLSNPVASTSRQPVASTSCQPVASTSGQPVASTSRQPVASTSGQPVASTSGLPDPDAGSRHLDAQITDQPDVDHLLDAPINLPAQPDDVDDHLGDDVDPADLATARKKKKRRFLFELQQEDEKGFPSRVSPRKCQKPDKYGNPYYY